MKKEDGFVLQSEFARVLVKMDTSANGVRLMIQDLRTGKVGYLDPLELECLAWANHRDLAPLLHPSLTRWKSEHEPETNDGKQDAE